MNNSKIEWTDKTWNPITGCNKVSQGCKNCYAEIMYERFNGKGTFTNVTFHKNRINAPYKWKRPAKIFVNSMSDLFHESLSFEQIREVLTVIYDNKRHTFQVLTKRPDRMFEFFKWLNNPNLSVNFSNLWIGISVEDQHSADERIPLLKSIPAAVRFLSMEPLIGPVNNLPLMGIDWVIVGGETGPKARPMHPHWVNTIHNHCKRMGVPFFFKQWGAWSPIWYKEIDNSIDMEEYTNSSFTVPKNIKMLMRNGEHNNRLFVDGFKNERAVFPMGMRIKKPDSYLLNGIQYHNFPKV